MEHYERTDKKVRNSVVVIPDLKYYRKAKPTDKKQTGDLFNIGKYNREEDEFVLATMDNGHSFGPWEDYYLVLKKRESNEK